MIQNASVVASVVDCELHAVGQDDRYMSSVRECEGHVSMHERWIDRYVFFVLKLLRSFGRKCLVHFSSERGMRVAEVSRVRIAEVRGMRVAKICGVRISDQRWMRIARSSRWRQNAR